MSVHDTKNDETRDAALTAALDAVRAGKLIVLPTDTVYGIGADAFQPEAVQALLDAKGRGRDVPPPVLVGDPAVLMALAVDVPEYAERLAEEFWPGALTLILTAQPTLGWDLGETRGTVALRMPDEEVALELLRRTGPLAVSSANRHGKDAALTVLDAATQLGDSVEVYLDGGTARIGTSSTIIDTTVEPAEIVREGALTREEIVAAVGDIFTAAQPEEPDAAEGAADAAESAAEGAATAETGQDVAADAPDATPAEAASPDEPAEAEPADAPPAPVLDLPRETDAEGTEGRAG
ncbi:L-threonylcarbamoyladenylate synthase [Brachybacterium huguangmaarense]|uniref:L-threonylcarbamoyladenylate synthase n=1 Tax=Brachybacterium huguangmaarense TaxID=1652028 RepID=A0ABY6FZ24_9MICO|nr:L-threonylcarbamoyladenylate synthase [Brachybacterium huguangmaarense]UYG15969.1 L-threonylcarbamoyladenylate synthase [Brachybacterium huguangmaarense]